MRIITRDKVFQAIYESIIHITYHNDPVVMDLIERARKNETDACVADVLGTISLNNEISSIDHIPLCQDTGTTIVIADLGSEVLISSGTLQEIANDAAAAAAKHCPLRASMVEEPLFDRKNTGNNSPAILHLNQVPGDQLRLRVAQKGGGAENMSFHLMLSPTINPEELAELIVERVMATGSRACPPLVIGIGIGANFERCTYLAKSALFEDIGKKNPDCRYAQLEENILRRINQDGPGAQGMGGNLTALAVHILFEPCHIASLPVAVNLQCHDHRHIEVTI
ncbi:MAG TPA: fumarate hydratase [Candidatus Cloacimonadota bacterium]|nr:fumarate hydratase [Candidatus Cloacimonadota bacterium]